MVKHAIEPRGIIQAAVFETGLGWLVLVGHCEDLLSSAQSRDSSKDNCTVLRLLLGGDTKREAEARWQNEIETDLRFRNWHSGKSSKIHFADWYPSCRKQLQEYGCGKTVDLSEIHCDLTSMTPFQQDVLKAARSISPGEVLTYGELARKIGKPKASRAVGASLGRNPVPIIIPCHRIIGASGQLTGFTAPGGIAFKEKLLKLEQR